MPFGIEGDSQLTVIDVELKLLAVMFSGALGAKKKVYVIVLTNTV